MRIAPSGRGSFTVRGSLKSAVKTLYAGKNFKWERDWMRTVGLWYMYWKKGGQESGNRIRDLFVHLPNQGETTVSVHTYKHIVSIINSGHNMGFYCSCCTDLMVIH